MDLRQNCSQILSLRMMQFVVKWRRRGIFCKNLHLFHVVLIYAIFTASNDNEFHEMAHVWGETKFLNHVSWTTHILNSTIKCCVCGKMNVTFFRNETTQKWWLQKIVFATIFNLFTQHFSWLFENGNGFVGALSRDLIQSLQPICTIQISKLNSATGEKWLENAGINWILIKLKCVAEQKCLLAIRCDMNLCEWACDFWLQPIAERHTWINATRDFMRREWAKKWRNSRGSPWKRLYKSGAFLMEKSFSILSTSSAF